MDTATTAPPVTIVHVLHGYYDGYDAYPTRAPFLSRGDAEWHARHYDRAEIDAVYVWTAAPAGYTRDHNGHAWWTYVRADGMALAIYPPYDAEHPGDETLAWYVVSRDGEVVYAGPDLANAHNAAETWPMDENA